MYHIIAATSNQAKVDAIKTAFDTVFGQGVCRIEGVNVDSSVPNQPIGSKETRTGARYRAMAARQVRPEADFWVGIEAGIEENMTFAWIVVENASQRGEARSASLVLPPSILECIHQGQELGEEMIHLTGLDDISQQGGAIGYFTKGKLTRGSVYQQAIILALVPFQNEIYQTASNS